MVQKLAGGTKTSNHGMALNGTQYILETTTATAPVYASLTELALGLMTTQTGPGFYFEGMHLPRRMTDAELVTVTT
jgi:hypothetical protein